MWMEIDGMSQASPELRSYCCVTVLIGCPAVSCLPSGFLSAVINLYAPKGRQRCVVDCVDAF